MQKKETVPLQRESGRAGARPKKAQGRTVVLSPAGTYLSSLPTTDKQIQGSGARDTDTIYSQHIQLGFLPLPLSLSLSLSRSPLDLCLCGESRGFVAIFFFFTHHANVIRGSARA